MYGPLKLMEDVSELLTFSAGEGRLSHLQQPSPCSKSFFSLSLVGHSEMSEELQGDSRESSRNVSIHAPEAFVLIVCQEMSRVKCFTMSIRCPCAALCTWTCSRSAWGSSYWLTGSQKMFLMNDLYVTKYNQTNKNMQISWHTNSIKL